MEDLGGGRHVPLGGSLLALLLLTLLSGHGRKARFDDYGGYDGQGEVSYKGYYVGALTPFLIPLFYRQGMCTVNGIPTVSIGESIVKAWLRPYDLKEAQSLR
jgi:hypothetical protein